MIAAVLKTSESLAFNAIEMAELGQGFDSFKRSARGTALDVTSETGARRTRLKYTVCRGSSRFAEAINVSTDISAGVELVESISAKASLYESL